MVLDGFWFVFYFTLFHTGIFGYLEYWFGSAYTFECLSHHITLRHDFIKLLPFQPALERWWSGWVVFFIWSSEEQEKFPVLAGVAGVPGKNGWFLLFPTSGGGHKNWKLEENISSNRVLYLVTPIAKALLYLEASADVFDTECLYIRTKPVASLANNAVVRAYVNVQVYEVQ